MCNRMLVISWAIFMVSGCTSARTGGCNMVEAKHRFQQLMGWGSGDSRELISRGAAIGMTDLITPLRGAKLEEAIALGREQGVKIYARIMLNTDVGAWKRTHPDIPPPLQPLNDDEQATLALLRAHDPVVSGFHQFGGEPTDDRDLYNGDMLSFHDPRVMALMREKIREVVLTSGLHGIALDGWGYQNLRCDRSELAMAAFAQFRAAQPPDISDEQALIEFSRQELVGRFNELADYARSLRPDIAITNHCWPSFAPEELYGSRLNIDYPGQTAAWFTSWPIEKIARYTRQMVRDEKAHYPRATAVAFIGFYNRPPQLPPKPVSQVQAELQAILDGGCDRLMVGNITDVLAVPDVAAVFARYRGHADMAP